jgi:hypothetical protein
MFLDPVLATDSLLVQNPSPLYPPRTAAKKSLQIPSLLELLYSAH